MEKNRLQTPILFLIFNRLDTTKLVFEQIKLAKPSRLYIGSDGARNNFKGEFEKVQVVRNYVLTQIDWDCEVKTNFYEENNGCKYAVSKSITWFFENEEKGIILEDDCLPSQSFFKFCDVLLNMYNNDFRVWHISGDNYQNSLSRNNTDYYFSIYNHIWGWATWANRWKNYNVELDNIEDSIFLSKIFENRDALRFWQSLFDKVKGKAIDTWDYQWNFTMWYYNGVAILPDVNLISNIGFSREATHTKDINSFSNMPKYELNLINHPTSIIINKKADRFTFNSVYNQRSFYSRTRRVKNIIRNISK